MLESNMSCFEQKYEMPGIPVSDGVLCGMFMVVTIEKKAKKFGLFLLSLYLCRRKQTTTTVILLDVCQL